MITNEHPTHQRLKSAFSTCETARSVESKGPAIGAPEPPHPRLQIVNGSSETIDVFWLKSDTERVANGTVAPGRDTFINTSLGHACYVQDRHDDAIAYFEKALETDPGFYLAHWCCIIWPTAASLTTAAPSAP